MDLRQVIRDVPDFPKPGIMFRDITPVMENPEALRVALAGMKELLADVTFDSFCAIESRGFLFGAPMGLDMDKPLVLMRKAGKLPAETRAVTYDLEYGQATLEMHVDSVNAGDRVIIVDDLLATGGTAEASARLITDAGGIVAGFLFMVELDFLAGRKKLENLGPVFSLVNYS
ncbi:MAG: adenine phosphoribosyltransferase [Candidatus Krumholzibacteriota bacterium]